VVSADFPGVLCFSSELASPWQRPPRLVKILLFLLLFNLPWITTGLIYAENIAICKAIKCKELPKVILKISARANILKIRIAGSKQQEKILFAFNQETKVFVSTPKSTRINAQTFTVSRWFTFNLEK
jgi:hypothetical protein